MPPLERLAGFSTAGCSTLLVNTWLFLACAWATPRRARGRAELVRTIS